MPSLKCQFKNEIKGRYVYNASKHYATPDEYKEKIFSTSTRDSYIQHAETFVSFLRKNNLKASTIEEAKQYVPVFLKHEIAVGKSACTIRSEACALAKVYRCSSNDFGVAFPKRSRKAIKNNRSKKEYSRHFSEARHRDIVCFAKATGLREEGMKKVKGTNIQIEQNGDIMVHIKEKGGRERDVLMFYSDENVYREARKVALSHIGKDEKIFENISKAAPIQAYRRAYAQSLYKSVARDIDSIPDQEKYICRNELSGLIFDKKALKIVSEALGHARLCVVVNNYIT